MRNRIIAIIFAMTIMTVKLWAGFTPTAYYILDGQETESTDAINDAQAPLTVTFKANPTDIDENIRPAYEWRFSKEGEETPYMIRYEEETVFEFTESGLTNVALYVTYNDSTDAELISTIKVSISVSLLEMPNAFSPNGDGINDIYKAKDNHKSIIEFHGYIFNRWGQKIFEWTDIDSGWDGTYKGKQVADGVYFALIKAKGADGRKYNIKKDVNILRNYIDEGTTNN